MPDSITCESELPTQQSSMVGDEIGDEEETLEILLSASRSPETRSALPSNGATAVAEILNRLSSPSPRFLLPRLLLLLLRNLCAGEAGNQRAFIASDGPDRVAAFIASDDPDRVAAAILRSTEAQQIGVQLLDNVALAGEDHRAAVWTRFFPTGFLELARVRGYRVLDPLSMVLDACCSSDGGRERLVELCGAERGGYEEEWLEWLLCKICIENPNLSLLFRKLGLSDVSATYSMPGCRLTKEQAFLLSVLSKCLTEQSGDVMISNAFVLDVLEVLKEASAVVDFSSRGNSALPTGSPAIDVLGYSLTNLRDICAWEVPSAREDPVVSLLSAGLIRILLNFLGELEPPSIVRKSIANGSGQTLGPTIANPLRVCPYLGFRRDVVSIISNCMYRRKHVQDEIRGQNGIPILLQQCVVDEENPFLREWGLFAVRNLLEGNVENQHEVADLQLQGPINTPEITGLGLKVEIDSINRRPKLVNIS